MALVLHVVLIFLTGFGFEKPSPRISSPMQIILVQTRSDDVSPDEEADFLAQANQKGGGTVEDTVHPTTITPAPFPAADTHIVSADAPPQLAEPARNPETEKLLSPEPSEEEIVPEPPREVLESPPDKGADSRTQVPAEQPDALKLIMDARRMVASMQVTLDRESNAFAEKMKPHTHIDVQTKESRFATYMETWRRKIERFGTLNFPNEARRQNISGELTLEVAIKSDGTVVEMDIRLPSGHRILDEAALRIVRLAAPFAPFPENIRKDTDVLHITRRWHFSSDGRLNNTW
jgi:protein TonB